MTTTIDYTADGSCKSFAVPFPFTSAGEVQVLLADVIQASGFILRGQGAVDGGVVLFDTAPPACTKVTIRHKGRVQVSSADVPGTLESKIEAGSNIVVTKVAGPNGEALRIDATVESDAFLRKDQNLSDLTDAAQARTNLGVLSQAQTEAAVDAVAGQIGVVKVSSADSAAVLEAKVEAGSNITVTKVPGVNGEALRIASTIDPNAYLRKDQNLSDLTDADQARTNLGVPSLAQATAAANAAVADLANDLGSAAYLDAGTGAGEVVVLDSSARLPAVDGSQLTNIPMGLVKVSASDTPAVLEGKLVAGSNVTLSKVAGAQGEALKVDVNVVPILVDYNAQLEINQAGDVLRQLRRGAQSLALRIDGMADGFADESGVGDKVSALYDGAGDYYHNPGSTGLIPGSTGTLIRSGNAYGGGTSLFDGATNQGTDSNNSWQGNWGWAGKDWGAGFSRVLSGFQVVPTTDYGFSGNDSMVSINLEASNDGSNWVVLYSTGAISDNFTTVSVMSGLPNAAYRFHRVTLSGSIGDMRAAEIHFYSNDAPTNMSLASIPVSAEAEPAQARILVLHQPMVAVTLNTDLVAEVSRDNGANWTPVTLVRRGAFDGSADVLTGLASLTGQPAGTAMKWRLRTFNNKQQRILGVALSWR